MARGLLVTGTDTNVGKTFVSCAVLAALAARGHRVGVYKPAETGVPTDAKGRLRGDDCTRLLAAAATDQPAETVSRALYEIPAAPLVSAEACGESIEPDSLAAGYRVVAGRFDAVWVEGAGGLLVPIAPGFTYADLALRLELPVLLVVGSKLGCINHALLTLAELDRRGIETIGVVLNGCEPGSDAPHAVATNRDTLSRFSRHRDLGALPWSEGASGAELASLAETHLDLATVERVLGLHPERG